MRTPPKPIPQPANTPNSVQQAEEFVNLMKLLVPGGTAHFVYDFVNYRANINGRTLEAEFEPDQKLVVLSFNWNQHNRPNNPTEPNSTYQRGKELQTGSIDFARTLKKLAQTLKQHGYRIEAPGADKKLDTTYQQNLEKIGFKRQGTGHYEHTFRHYLEQNP